MPEKHEPSQNPTFKKINPDDFNLAKQEQGKKEFMDFYGGLEKMVNQYFQNPDILFTFKQGKGFYIDLEKLQTNFDPDFYLKLGLEKSELLFGMFHEAEHFRDMMQGEEEYEDQWDRLKEISEVNPGYGKALKRFHNIIDDVMVNRTVTGRWAGASQTLLKNMYHKLFPGTDYSKGGLHRQFGDALIRELMIPAEKCKVEPEVRKKIDEIIAEVDYISEFDLAKQAANMTPPERFAYIEEYLEPIFKQFYEEEKERKEKQKGEKGEESEPEEGEEGEDESDMLDPLDHQDLFDQIKKINDKIRQNKKNDFKKQFEVSLEDYQWYKKEYQQIEQYVNEMVEFFKKFIQARIFYKKVKKIKREGDYIPPQLLNEAYIRLKSGNLDDAKLYIKKIEQQMKEEFFTDFELTIVADGSGSMGDKFAVKNRTQRRGALLLVSAIAQFEDYINSLQKQGEPIQMGLKTQVREFADKDDLIKDFGEAMDMKTRVGLIKRLAALSAGSNNEMDSFDKIEIDLRRKLKDIKSGKLKKLIIFTTDGDSDSAAIQARIANLYKMTGNAPNFKLIGVGLGKETKKVGESYAPYGYPEVEIADFAGLLSKELEKFIAAEVKE